MSNSAVFFVPAAHVAPGLSLSLSLRTHPKRGAGGAPTGALVLLSRLRGATSARVRRGAAHDAGGSPLGAPPGPSAGETTRERGREGSLDRTCTGTIQASACSQVWN